MSKEDSEHKVTDGRGSRIKYRKKNGHKHQYHAENDGEETELLRWYIQDARQQADKALEVVFGKNMKDL